MGTFLRHLPSRCGWAALVTFKNAFRRTVPTWGPGSGNLRTAVIADYGSFSPCRGYTSDALDLNPRGTCISVECQGFLGPPGPSWTPSHPAVPPSSPPHTGNVWVGGQEGMEDAQPLKRWCFNFHGKSVCCLPAAQIGAEQRQPPVLGIASPPL